MFNEKRSGKMAQTEGPEGKDKLSEKKERAPCEKNASGALERGGHHLKRSGKKLSKPLVPYYKNIKTLMTHEFTILSTLAAIIGLFIMAASTACWSDSSSAGSEDEVSIMARQTNAALHAL